jgi:hypothetical protein
VDILRLVPFAAAAAVVVGKEYYRVVKSVEVAVVEDAHQEEFSHRLNLVACFVLAFVAFVVGWDVEKAVVFDWEDDLSLNSGLFCMFRLQEGREFGYVFLMAVEHRGC